MEIGAGLYSNIYIVSLFRGPCTKYDLQCAASLRRGLFFGLVWVFLSTGVYLEILQSKQLHSPTASTSSITNNIYKTVSLSI